MFAQQVLTIFYHKRVIRVVIFSFVWFDQARDGIGHAVAVKKKFKLLFFYYAEVIVHTGLVYQLKSG